MPHATALTRLALVLLTVCGMGAPGDMVEAAESVWRCPTPGGTGASYQALPCPEAGQQLLTHSPPTGEQRKASARMAERQSRLAQAMGRERARRERALHPAHTSLSGPVRQVSVGQRPEEQLRARQRRALHARPHRTDVFRAEAPGTARKGSRATQADAASESPP